MEIDSIEKRSADPADVAFDLHGTALARPARVPQISARARIHGGDQNEAGRKCRGSKRSRNGDMTFFERLTQDFQAASIEFGKFVQEEDAVVSEADFPWGRCAAASHHAGIADRVMRRPKRTRGQKRF